MSLHDLGATVVAVATPPGRGGVGCVRISGPDAPTVAGKLFRPTGQISPNGKPAFGRFLDREGRGLDHGYLVQFAAGASFSGEPTAELWAHGSPAVLRELVEAALAAGARAAGPGEFTYRALRSGRLDLARAEAVRDLVEARTSYQARVAFAQAEGALSQRIAPVCALLETEIANAEAAVEFVDESDVHLGAGELRQAIDRAHGLCAELLRGFRTGRVVRDGASLAMVGSPNVGKSSLFNALLARDRAIVTEVAGTTRDTLEEQLDLDGVPLRLIDTAGLRDVADPVEAEGVRRARRAHEEADLVLFVLDGSRPPDDSELRTLERLDAEARTTVVVNKCDLDGSPFPGVRGLRVSARTGAGLAELRERLRACLIGSGPVEDPIVTNGRHAHELSEAVSALERAGVTIDNGFSEELVLEDLRAARNHLGAITGEFTNESLYDRIFSSFCIGK